MPKELVLITGASGHLGFRTLVLTLQAGYRTRVALRRLEQSEKIKNVKSIQPYLDSIEFVQVPDITASEAYNDAIKGVDYVLHIASPIYTGFDADDKDWKKLLYDPATKGTTSILIAAAKEPSVKRIVITSSVVALDMERKNGQSRIGPYDLAALPDEETLNNIPTAQQAYRVSKILSHQAATDFMQETKPTFDLIRVLPGYIQGAHELYTSAEELRNDKTSGSNEGTMNTALGNRLGEQRSTAQVLLDDVARAHLFALGSEVAKDGDNLVIVGSGGNSLSWNDYVPVIQRLFPDAVKEGVINPKAEDPSPRPPFDVASSEKALGYKFAGPEEIVKSVVGQYLELVGHH